MKLYVGLLITFISFYTHSSPIYKCKDSSGKLNFSDQPCTGQGEVFEAKNKITEVKSLGPDSETARKILNQPVNKKPRYTAQILKPCKKFYSAELRNLIVKDKIVVGMAAKDVKKAWGAPTKINRSSHGSDQWIYRYKGGASYVYMENGCVSSWQQR